MCTIGVYGELLKKADICKVMKKRKWVCKFVMQMWLDCIARVILAMMV